MESWKSNCLVIESDPEARQKITNCVSVHGFGMVFCDGLKTCPPLEHEPDTIIFGPGAIMSEDDDVSDMELLIRECQIPILCWPDQKAMLDERYEDVHSYHGCEDITHMVLSYVLSHARRRNIREMMLNAVEGISHLNSGEFVFKNFEEAQALARLLSSLSPDKKILRLGMMELFVNAIEHGNLEITHEEKIDLRNQGRWVEEIEKRQEDAVFRERCASLKLKRDNDRLYLRLEDEGQGFDWEKVMKAMQEKANLTKSGRGIVIVQKSGLENISYIGKGNIVECSFEITNKEGL
ncbi:ATP-binding protein [Terasakiella sp. SH-1]|uniref:ATP-binding protein n=1 Tax=Terasakiella sp. SH-1 TaxID=2560057 RepID=UPI001073D8CF|nr:ATP-binding protein [Terasakiella sp. SH-1]